MIGASESVNQQLFGQSSAITYKPQLRCPKAISVGKGRPSENVFVDIFRS